VELGTPRAVAPNGALRACECWRLVAADLSDLSVALLDDVETLRAVVARAVGNREVQWIEHRFSPRGASLVGTGVDFRIVLHTWPERGALTLDLACPEPSAEPLLQSCVDAVLAVARA
jgi:S-adenosylmethionine/arginine decarboxylase-like enzyme